MSGTVVIKKKPWFLTPLRGDGVLRVRKSATQRVTGSGSGFDRGVEDINENK